MKDYIDAAAFKEMALCAEAALHANMQLINELNVFPVPDGDTGTNMCLTMQTAATELRKRSFDTVTAAADCMANALLRGARGNSGVILSLLFRGISKRLKGMETAGTVEFAEALNAGVDAAYKAVMKPAEGTILTVSRLASKAAGEAASLGADLEGVFLCALKAGTQALAETQNINPVLKKAGVVDAGGKGYLIILQAMFDSLKGKAVSGEATGEIHEQEENVFAAFDTEEITFAYDTVYIVRKDDPDVDLTPLRDYLASIGDCLVISEGDDIFKVHVHTDIPGEALTQSQKYGTLELAKIENMRAQHEAVSKGEKAMTTDDLEAVEKELESMEGQEASEDTVAAPEKETGTVAVCAGAGMEELFKELGVDQMVTGGQTMNPSTDDILHAINRTPAETVLVFPNNKNIIMAAEQCIPLTEKKVIVVPTKTVPQGITCMLNFNPEAAAAAQAEEMAGMIPNVHTAMVTYAARDSDFDGYDIHAGEYLGLLDGALIGSYTELPKLFAALGEAAGKLNPEFITVYYGESVSEEDAAAAGEVIGGSFPEAEVNVVNGGQPVYYYMIAIE